MAVPLAGKPRRNRPPPAAHVARTRSPPGLQNGGDAVQPLGTGAQVDGARMVADGEVVGHQRDNDYFCPANSVYGIGSASQYSANASRKPAVMSFTDWLSSVVNLTNRTGFTSHQSMA